jgi:hypothetical protein
MKRKGKKQWVILRSSGMKRSVVWSIGAVVSEESATKIFKVEEVRGK